MAKLARFVFARDERGALRRYGPNDDVPAAVAKTITMPGVWADEEPAKKPAAKRSPSKKSAPKSEPAPSTSSDDDGDSAAGDGEPADEAEE